MSSVSCRKYSHLSANSALIRPIASASDTSNRLSRAFVSATLAAGFMFGGMSTAHAAVFPADAYHHAHLIAQDEAADIEELIEQLESKDVDERRDAAYALAALGSDAEKAVPALIEAIGDRDPQVVAASLTALARIGPAAEEAIPKLVERMGRRGSQDRYRAAFALGSIGPAAVPVLQEKLSDRRSTTRADAAMALRWVGDDAQKCLIELAMLLDDDSQEVREVAAGTLGEIGAIAEPVVSDRLQARESNNLLATLDALTRIGAQEPKTLEQLKTLLDHSEVDVRMAAIAAIRRSAITPQTQAELALKSLRDRDSNVRAEAIESLTRLGKQVETALPQLVEYLKSDDETLRTAAGQALGRLGSLAEPALQDMVSALGQDEATRTMVLNAFAAMGKPAVDDVLVALDRELIDQDRASETLGRMGPEVSPILMTRLTADNPHHAIVILRAMGDIEDPRPEVTEAIVSFLEVDDLAVRREAIVTLGSRSRVSSEVISLLFQQLDEAEGRLRASLLKTLVQVKAEPSRLQSHLTAALSADEPFLRLAAVESLALLNSIDQLDKEALTRLSHDESLEVRTALAKALSSDKARPESVEALITLLADSSAEVREQAATSTGIRKLSTPEILTALGQLIASEVDSDRSSALDALQTIGASASTTLPQLTKLLESPEPTWRAGASKVLGEFSDSLDTVIPLLIERLKDPDWTVRNAATDALAKFKTDAKPAVPELAHLLLSEEDRVAVRTALRAIDTAGPEAVPALLTGAQHDDGAVRFMSVYLLGKVGPEAKDALPVLRELAEKDQSRLKGFLIRTIESIEGKSADGDGSE